MRCVREFDWDDEKEAANVRKHGISFDEARSVFSDPGRLEIPDRLDYRNRRFCASNAASVDSSRPPVRAGARFRTSSAWGASLSVEAH
jgi:hypothetical protein